MSTNVRHQLTLFVPEAQSGELEAVRRVLDPVQSALIAAHVTLCREDELAELSDDVLAARSRTASPVVLSFGAPERFATHGVLLPCVAGLAAFQALRCHMLGLPSARAHAAHITLAHPRNSKASGNTAEGYGSIRAGLTVRFEAVSLIRQRGFEPWHVQGLYGLGSGPG